MAGRMAHRSERGVATASRCIAIASAALALVAASLGPMASTAGAAVGDCVPSPGWGTADRTLAAQVVQLVNDHRAAMGLGALSVAPTLTASAEWKSLHMAAFNYLGHDDPGPPVARTASQRLDACGYPTAAGWGENIAFSYPDAASVVNAWLSDAGHKANIESATWTTTGVGVARNASGQPYWTQDFGTTGGSSPPPPVSTPSDTQAPSIPAGLTVTATSQTTLGVTWQGSSDNVGVSGYDLFVNGSLLGTTATTTGAINGIACGTSYTVGVDVFDSAGNRSAMATAAVLTGACSTSAAPSQPATPPPPSGGSGGGSSGAAPSSSGSSSGAAPATIPASLSPAPAQTTATTPSAAPTGGSAVAPAAASPRVDRKAPIAPTRARVLRRTPTTVELHWHRASDDVRVAFYRVFRDGIFRLKIKSTAATISGLACGRAHTIQIAAFDAAGQESKQLRVRLRARACP